MKFYKFRVAFFLLFARIFSKLLFVEFPPIPSSGAIIEKDGKILVLNLSYMKGYGLPGGVIGGGEDGEESLIREVKEETGLTVTKCEYFCTVTGDYGPIATAVSFVYKVSVEGDIQASEEGELLWVTPQEAVKNMAYKNAEKVLELYITRANV